MKQEPDMHFKRLLSNTLRRVPLMMDGATWGYRFLQGRASIGVVGAIVNDDERVLVVEHVFHARYPWGLPGGWLGRRESPNTGLRRECMEELGLPVDVVKPVLVERVRRFSHLDIVYYCRPRGAVQTLSNELLQVRWVDVNNMPPLSPLHLRGVVSAINEHRISQEG